MQIGQVARSSTKFSIQQRFPPLDWVREHDLVPESGDGLIYALRLVEIW